MKRILSLCVILALIINSLSTIAYAGDFAESLYLEYDNTVYKYGARLVTVVINDVVVETGDMPAVILDSRTLVPVREVFESEAFGASVDWNGDKQEVYIAYKDKLIVLAIDSDVAYVNGEAHTLDVPAKLIRDLSKDYSKTMIPLRFVSEILEFDVAWDNESFTAILKNEKLPTAQPEEQEPVKVDDGSVAGEKLDGLSGAGANRELPTPLKDNPVSWSASSDQLTEIDDSYVENSITNENHDETKIKRVKYDDTGLYKSFIIESSSAMSGIDQFIWDGKFIIDISNSINELETEYTYPENPILTSIRSSQYSISPNSTRIVFDLRDGGNKFDLSFNEDRTELIISVMDNSIHNIYLGQNEIGDFITVTGVAAPDAKMFRLSNPDRIVIDFPNTITVLGFNESLAEGQYVNKIRTAQFDTTTARIVVETDGQADYEITKADNGQTVIQFKEPGYENIVYENDEKPTIKLEETETDISIEGIVYDNDYRNRTFTITLGQNYGALFGEGSLKVNDGIIETIDIDETDEGLTKIVIESTKVYEYRVEEVEGAINIKAYKPKELYDQIIVVDPGHGGKDPGAIDNDLWEKHVNLTITEYLKELFDVDDTVQVYYTRLIDEYPALQERVDLANEVEADVFLSIHNNAYNPSYTGTETLYFPSQASSTLTSYGLASIMQQAIIAGTGNNDRGLKDRENLFVLRHTEMPAVIVEIGYLTNTNDSTKLKEEAYLRLVAKALYDGVKTVFTTYPTRR